jgi:protein SCO1/2
VPDAPTSRLAVVREAPSLALTDQDGKSVKSTDLKEKALLVSFIFTTCNGTCPATTHRMFEVQQELARRGLFKGGRIQLLSITLDPARDTPEVLRAYMRLYDIEPKNWKFLTGTPEAVGRVVHEWGMWAKPAANGQLDHPSRIYLVDLKGRIREIYNLGFMKPAWVAEDIGLLLDER